MIGDMREDNRNECELKGKHHTIQKSSSNPNIVNVLEAEFTAM